MVKAKAGVGELVGTREVQEEVAVEDMHGELTGFPDMVGPQVEALEVQEALAAQAGQEGQEGQEAQEDILRTTTSLSLRRSR